MKIKLRARRAAEARTGLVTDTRLRLERAQEAFACVAERAGKTWISVADGAFA